MLLKQLVQRMFNTKTLKGGPDALTEAPNTDNVFPQLHSVAATREGSLHHAQIHGNMSSAITVKPSRCAS